jgi:[ribosomal protein S18]-alanine N-acetyltransferase
LIQNALRTIAGPAIIDVPDAHPHLSRWLEAQGAVRQRGFMRMVLGETTAAIDDPRQIFALAGPELG